MIKLQIVGTAIYATATQMPSLELDRLLGQDEGWTEKKFGIHSRGIASTSETTSVMAAEAATIAMKKAGWDSDNPPDVIISACGIMEQPIPSTSVLIQQKLGLGKSGIPVFDVNLTCLSFLSALDIASMGIQCGRWKKVLIVSSDIASAGLDYSVPEVASIFGDGAAAVCLENATESNAGILAQGFETYGDGYNLATLRSGGTRIRIEDGFEEIKKGAKFEMDTFGIFKAAAKSLPRLIDRVLTQGGHTRESINHIVCHQASAPAIEHIRRLFPSNPGRVVDIFSRKGNQIATSIPTALSYAIEEGLIKRGDTVLLIGTAAGISAGVILMRI